MLSPDDVSLDEFRAALVRYPAVMKAVSKSKGTKSGQKSLETLDEYRYHEALENFDLMVSKHKLMGLEDVKTLVEWKLRHGKFRPTLMNLVTSNDPSNVTTTIQKAMKAYDSDHNASKAVDTLATLRGIGPATASLLLAVHDPFRVVFFGDEVFYWLCCDGKVAPIKYNAKEYRELQQRAADLVERLGVQAVDVEKVAFVMMRGDAAGGEAEPAKVKAEASADVKPGKGSAPEPSAAKTKTTAKRKQGPDTATETAPATNNAVRRSKRERRA